MGLTSSKDPKTENQEYNPQNDQVRSEKLIHEALANSPIDWENPRKAGKSMILRELYALFPPKQEGDDLERITEAGEQFSEFVKRGKCKESVMALEDCIEKSEGYGKCGEASLVLWRCFFSHLDYYQPFIDIFTKYREELSKHESKSKDD